MSSVSIRTGSASSISLRCLIRPRRAHDAATLGVREVVGQPLLTTLSGFLADKRLLFLLDNCEHVVAAALDVAALLAQSDRLHPGHEPGVAASPRRARGPLSPLALPAADRLLPIDELARVPAVALFVDLASASWPHFALTAENSAAVAAICQRLDGLPLAIELAAARIKSCHRPRFLARLDAAPLDRRWERPACTATHHAGRPCRL